VELLGASPSRHEWTRTACWFERLDEADPGQRFAVTVGEGTTVVSPVPTFTLYRLLTEVSADATWASR